MTASIHGSVPTSIVPNKVEIPVPLFLVLRWSFFLNQISTMSRCFHISLPCSITPFYSSTIPLQCTSLHPPSSLHCLSPTVPCSLNGHLRLDDGGFLVNVFAYTKYSSPEIPVSLVSCLHNNSLGTEFETHFWVYHFCGEFNRSC